MKDEIYKAEWLKHHTNDSSPLMRRLWVRIFRIFHVHCTLHRLFVVAFPLGFFSFHFHLFICFFWWHKHVALSSYVKGNDTRLENVAPPTAYLDELTPKISVADGNTRAVDAHLLLTQRLTPVSLGFKVFRDLCFLFCYLCALCIHISLKIYRK